MAWNKSTTVAVDYLGTPGTPVAIPVAYAAGAIIDTEGLHKYIAFLSKITTAGSATDFRLKIEVSADGSNFQDLKTEAVTAGVGVLDSYILSVVVAANAGHTVGIKCNGWRYFRVSWLVDNVTGTPLGYVQYALSGGPI